MTPTCSSRTAIRPLPGASVAGWACALVIATLVSAGARADALPGPAGPGAGASGPAAPSRRSPPSGLQDPPGSALTEPVPSTTTPSKPTPSPERAARQARTFLVHPFENTSEDRSLYWVAEGIADGLSRAIRESGGSVVDRRDRVAARSDIDVPALSTPTLASQIRIAEELEAGFLVTGDFDAVEGILTVRARVIEVAAGRMGPWIIASGSVKGLIALQESLFQQVRPSLPGLPAARAAADGGAEDGVPQAAYELLLKSFVEDSLEKREKLLRRALDLAPDYLRAKIELALVYRAANHLEKAAATLASIATSHPSLGAEAENVLAETEMELGHSATAESALRRSLAMKETARGHLLLARLALARGDRAYAGAELRRSRALDPTDPELAELEEALSRSR